MAFHPLCARQSGVLRMEWHTLPDGTMFTKAFCEKHSSPPKKEPQPAPPAEGEEAAEAEAAAAAAAAAAVAETGDNSGDLLAQCDDTTIGLLLLALVQAGEASAGDVAAASEVEEGEVDAFLAASLEVGRRQCADPGTSGPAEAQQADREVSRAVRAFLRARAAALPDCRPPPGFLSDQAAGMAAQAFGGFVPAARAGSLHPYTALMLDRHARLGLGLLRAPQPAAAADPTEAATAAAAAAQRAGHSGRPPIEPASVVPVILDQGQAGRPGSAGGSGPELECQEADEQLLGSLEDRDAARLALLALAPSDEVTGEILALQWELAHVASVNRARLGRLLQEVLKDLPRQIEAAQQRCAPRLAARLGISGAAAWQVILMHVLPARRLSL